MCKPRPSQHKSTISQQVSGLIPAPAFAFLAYPETVSPANSSRYQRPHKNTDKTSMKAKKRGCLKRNATAFKGLNQWYVSPPFPTLHSPLKPPPPLFFPLHPPLSDTKLGTFFISSLSCVLSSTLQCDRVFFLQLLISLPCYLWLWSAPICLSSYNLTDKSL